MKSNNKQEFNCVIAGGGVAGLVTALNIAEQSDQRICIIDRDMPERLGGLARWAFGGMALCGTTQQRRAKIPDSPARLLKDWHNFAEYGLADYWPKAWAKEYAEHNHDKVYQWLQSLGLSFLPAVNWVERGLLGQGNSVPRYHVLWGTGWHLVETIIEKLAPFIASGQVTILHRHKVLAPRFDAGQLCGVRVLNEVTAQNFVINAPCFVVACGGINGSMAQVKKNWYKPWGKPPSSMLNGANPISDGQLHQQIAEHGGLITHSDKMWNYAAGIAHPQPEFEEHGLSLIPSKSALWLDHSGKRIGPQPLVTGFDTRYLCQQVAKQAHPWTWQVMNWKIAKKELAVSGSQHNPSIRDKNLLGLAKETLFGNQRLVEQLAAESADFIVADDLTQLAEKMNDLTGQALVDLDVMRQAVADYDLQLAGKGSFENDDQARRIRHARQWKVDKLRTCNLQPISDSKAGPLIAIKLQLISRKSLGGIQTNLSSQVLTQAGEVIDGLYCVGEAAGFGGGGASGLRSLEGTFLSGCILTARNAAQAIIEKSA